MTNRALKALNRRNLVIKLREEHPDWSNGQIGIASETESNHVAWILSKAGLTRKQKPQITQKPERGPNWPWK